MMKEYLRERNEREHNATMTGIFMTLAIHVCAVLLVSFTGIKYLYPPPPESTFLLDFEEEEVAVKQRPGKQPRSEDVDREKPVELVQRSESPMTAANRNLTPEATPDNFGDVETPAPKQEPEINRNALFPGMSAKDTTITAPHSAKDPSEVFKAGQTSGNVKAGNTENAPNAHLEGRFVDKAGLKKPSYGNSQESGKVVVKIWVDQYGKVQKAVPGADGTTVTDKTLWSAARNAALETGFNMKSDAPALQEGTITYIFNLK